MADGVVDAVGAVSNTQQRLLGILLRVAESGNPLRLTEISRAYEVSDSLALRDMQNLREAGLARQNEDGQWIAGPVWEMVVRRAMYRELTKMMESYK